jgi:multiple sugar transport system ATP-binding protein
MPSLELKHIKKTFQGFVAVNDVSFSAEPGEFVVMVGPSGCGKSSLLRSIAGLERIDGGSIHINGRDITDVEPAERGVAMVFQNYALYPHMTVAENMGFALKIAGRSKADIDKAVLRAASILRIEDHLHKKPKALSGGQRQRVAIGRAITRSPEIFLFDEPLSNLDAALRSQMRIELSRLHAELKATMVYVTHDQTEAMTMADRIVVLNAGQIEQVGSPLELYNQPRNRFVAGFLGAPKMNFFKGTVIDNSAGSLVFSLTGLEQRFSVSCPPQARELLQGTHIVAGIRPESLKESLPGTSGLAAHLAIVENLGRETLLYIDAGDLRTFESESMDGFIAMQCSSQVNHKAGETLHLSLDPDLFFLFDADGLTLRTPSSPQ